MGILDCLEEKIEARCEVQFSISLLYIVIACNVAKVILMTVVLWRLNEKTLVTIGDAVDSFLQLCDPTTERCCLASKRNIISLWKTPLLRCNQRWKPRSREPWFNACSARRWFLALFLYIATLSGTIYLYKISREAGGGLRFGEVSSCKLSLLARFHQQPVAPANLPSVSTTKTF